jgi:hypothetical protein
VFDIRIHGCLHACFIAASAHPSAVAIGLKRPDGGRRHAVLNLLERLPRVPALCHPFRQFRDTVALTRDVLPPLLDTAVPASNMIEIQPRH